jgi:hypothetical protein
VLSADADADAIVAVAVAVAFAVPVPSAVLPELWEQRHARVHGDTGTLTSPQRGIT